MKVRNVSISIPMPSIDYLQEISSIKRKVGHISVVTKRKINFIFHSFITMLNERKIRRESYPSENPSFANNPKFSSEKFGKPAKIILVALLLLGVVVLVGRVFGNRPRTLSSSSNLDVKNALSSIDLNKEYTFPLKSNKGEKVADLKFMIEKAELRDEIIVKGQRATAVKGRVFLILTVKITNEYKSRISIDTRDYVRLSVNGNEEEWLAPDIHNDPVEVQAISTKYTRLGFAINDSDKNLILSIGEINGDKDKIPLEFK